MESNILAIAPDDGIVSSRGDSAIALGVLTSYFFDDPDRSSLPVATGDLIRRLRDRDSGMHESGSQQSIEVDKQAALLTPFTSSSPTGGVETDLLITVARPEGLFYLMFPSPERESGETRPLFDHMVRSIRFHESKA